MDSASAATGLIDDALEDESDEEDNRETLPLIATSSASRRAADAICSAFERRSPCTDDLEDDGPLTRRGDALGVQ